MRKTCRGEVVVWLIFADRLQYIARLFSRNFCARTVPIHVLGESQEHSKSASFQLGTKVVLIDSRLEQAEGFTKVPFKSELSDLGSKDHQRRILGVYIAQQFCRFFQVTLTLINAGLKCHQIWIVGQDVERSITQL